ncbi:MAG TPA: DNA topoisomerase 4 subunit A, partial [Firmicutes bacterium]|nr:DNA topoisomerase 4 subunit A [Bacillota bacterium]
MNEKVSEDNIIQVDISQEMKSSYLDYSMSVIVGRALPDARDGLKPVHRRILYGMYQMGLRPDSAYKKSARVVGEVMGKYHPHGDMALYDALVRMAQGFSMRYQLVDGQGNFGSVDGDSPAAMRYTEARLTPIAMTMLADIEKQTVNFVPNFDDTMKEPVVLPTMIPNLILNGSDGIAVGMATRIPPHNLSEVVSAIIELIKDPKMDTNELLKYVKGPDFPTGGYIVGRKGITDAYKRGRGKITIRAKINEEVSQTGRKRLVVSEIPFQVNKARLIEQIAELVRNRKIEGISDIRDESDREGLRVVIELKRGEDVKSVIHKLLKLTSLETTFGIIMLALDDGRPRILTLKEILEIFIKHRREVVTRRSEFLLNKAEERAHILQGLMVAVDNIDEVVAIIKKASDVDNARRTLMKRFKLSESQAQAILDMKLSRLTTMERGKIAEELENTLKEIDYLRAILGAPELLDEEIVKELKTIRERFGDERKTTIIDEDEIAGSYEVIPREEQVVIVTRAGYLKRMSETSFTRLRSRI